MPADPPVPVWDDPLSRRWNAVPSDTPIMRRWLARRREQAAAYEPLPPVPEEPGQ